jgi:putative addiction module killer protein
MWILFIIEVRQTERFSQWFEHLRDRAARAMVLVRIDKLRLGLYGNVEPVGHGVSEVKIDYGPGYRLYFTKKGLHTILLLAGGDKSTRNRNIRSAQELAKLFKESI